MKDKIFLAEYKKLNDRQKQAVDEIEGPVMVIAGPGTGKTQILAMRVANILRKIQTNPSNILCLTFTNSAVFALKQRLLEIIGPPAYQIQIHTFHGFCNEVISTFPEKFLIAKKINQLDDLEQVFSIQKILKNHHYQEIKPLKSPYYYQKAILETIGKLKQENITPESFFDILKKDQALFNQEKENLSPAKIQERQKQISKNLELAKVYKLYQKNLTKEGKYDYHDMILFVLNALRNDSELLSHYQEKFQYILVDEFQDTNSAQNEIVKILASFYDLPNVFVVGDDEQSIFRFQGASMENILTFQKDWPKTRTVVLKENYRSGQNILDASRAVITQNKNQIFNLLKINKNLKSQIKKLVGEIKLGQFSNAETENFFIGQEILKLTKEKKVPFSEIAVLYKEHRDAESLIELLSKLNIPYQFETGENILNDPEINKLITFFKVLNCQGKVEDNQPLLETMHYPFFKIPPLDIYKIVAATKRDESIFKTLSSDFKDLKLEKEKIVAKFLEQILICRQIVQNNTFSAAFEKIINQTGYLDYLLSLKDDISHLNRLQTLFKYIQNLNVKQKNLNLEKFLEHLDLLEENNLSIKEEDISGEFEGVKLLTAHKAKGLEFKIVFLMRLSDKHWGNKIQRNLIKLPDSLLTIQKDFDKNEEERRLFYVCLTRAKEIVYLTYAESYGEIENQIFSSPSEFIEELPKKFLDEIDTKKYEESFDKRLKLKFAPKKWFKSQALTEFLKSILKEFQLNPTALNGFLECPQRFFYDYILRVPKAKDFNQSYGTAIHFALQRFFQKFKQEMILPQKSKLVEYFKEGLKNEILDAAENKHALKQGSVVLKKYYDFYLKTWQKRGAPISCEFNFGFHDVHYEKIPITGRIDKIELVDSISNKIRIIDYKTSSPKSLNQILGKTKEKDFSLLFQAYFYKLLAECDPLFSWQVGEIVFDFISQAGFKQVAVPIEEKNYQEFKKQVADVYQKIISLDFPKSPESCKKRNRKCAYLNICHS